MNPHSPLWVRIERALKLLSHIANEERGSYMEADLILSAMAKEQDEYDAWVNSEEARYKSESGCDYRYPDGARCGLPEKDHLHHRHPNAHRFKKDFDPTKEPSIMGAYPENPPNETATEWLARMKKEGRIPNE